MARVTIVIEDDEDTGMPDVTFDFDPPMERDKERWPSQMIAMSIAQSLQTQAGGTLESINGKPISE